MNRARAFWTACREQDDTVGLVLLGLCVLVMLWIGGLFATETVQRSTMRKFHLGTESFTWWALQQPVPSMYIFENHAVFTNDWIEQGSFDDARHPVKRQALNHYPSQYVTFGNRVLFDPYRSGTLEMRSRYGTLELRSRWKLEADAEGRIVVLREPEQWMPRE